MEYQSNMYQPEPQILTKKRVVKGVSKETLDLFKHIQRFSLFRFTKNDKNQKQK